MNGLMESSEDEVPVGESKLTAWVQIAATIAVVIGLILVVIELRQAKEIAAAENANQFFVDLIANHRMAIGEDPAASLAKACTAPESLDARDRIVLRSYFRAWHSLAMRNRNVNDTGDFGVDWRIAVRLIFEREIAPYGHGRQVLREVSSTDAEVAEIATAVMEDTTLSCREWLE